MKVVVSAEAMADLNRLRGFLADNDLDAAGRAMAVLRAALRSLAILPGRGRPSGIPGMRELVVPFGRSAYLVRYAHLADQETVLIVRIWHGREARE